MADQDRGQRWPEGGSGRALSRAWTAPVRAVSRMLHSADGTPVAEASPPPEPRSGIVDCALYIDGIRQPGSWKHPEALATARRERNAFVWLGLHEPSLAEMAGIADTYGLHELAVEDAVKAEQRPKLEQFGEVHFLVLRTARYVDHEKLTGDSEVVETGQVMLFIGQGFVITVRHGDACRLAPVRADLERNRDLMVQGPWAVAYAVTDRVVDLYLEVTDRVETDLDTVEADVFSPEASDKVHEIYQLKRELVEFKRTVAPLQRPMMTLTAEINEVVPVEIRRYFRDVQDHLSRVVEQVNAYDDLLNSILQARLAQVTVAQNNDMRKIAAWAGIAAVWTALAGIYGMNFEFMPETGWTFGYPIVLALMLGISLVLYRSFRRNGWL
ncbi:magnesium and cobalt transport protein CorA [Solwaraspora sp. WMMD406]|uniref:magnesium and cobalt transport protein CorA n=1 Tax=Solwaraspora sp. WMMD406 TaxID=3016095 RepID=UPI002417232C|nr:magnesium and cobalt transport protein CorA [Solwaraspora sp. WMMD406]MDG4762815.1 magnesium and cobalt transport protein CorA [Solwaraspora sp. WMMD406]